MRIMGQHNLRWASLGDGACSHFVVCLSFLCRFGFWGALETLSKLCRNFVAGRANFVAFFQNFVVNSVAAVSSVFQILSFFRPTLSEAPFCIRKTLSLFCRNFVAGGRGHASRFAKHCRFFVANFVATLSSHSANIVVSPL